MGAFGELTTLLFDADGTLWDFDDAMRRAMGVALAEIDRTLPGGRGHLTVDSLIGIRDRVAANFAGRAPTHEEIRLEAFRRALAEIGRADDELARSVTDLYLRERFEGIRLYDDVLPTLDLLRERFALGLLTNGNTYPDRCGLAGRFAFTVFGQDHGLQKPDRRLFDIALERAGCARRQIVNIGDSIANDVVGAQRAGIAAFWLNRRGERNDSGVKPDGEIRSLDELLAIL